MSNNAFWSVSVVALSCMLLFGAKAAYSTVEGDATMPDIIQSETEKTQNDEIMDYSFYMQAPEIFPAELVFAQFSLNPEDSMHYSFGKIFLKNGKGLGGRIENEKPLPYKAYIMWYSITENKVYFLEQDLPNEQIKEKIKNDEDKSYGLLFTLAPYGEVVLYAYDSISEEKEYIDFYRAEEYDMSLEDFRKYGAFYENPEEPAKNWDEYQLRALASFDKANEFLADKGLPGKDFDFWADIAVDDVEYDVPDELDELDENGQTPLINAVASKKSTLVTKLIVAGADLNAHSSDTGATALSTACAMGHLPYVKQLIIAGADVDAPETQSGMTPLMLATQSGYIEVVDALLKAGADVNAKQFMYDQDLGYNALRYAKEGNNHEIVDLLVAAGAKEPIVKESFAAEPASTLDLAVMGGDTAQVKKLLAEGADPNTMVPGIGPALVYACMINNAEMAEALIEAKADINGVAASGYTPLMMAVQAGQVDLVKVLLAAGADVNIQHQYNGQYSGQNALSIAENSGLSEIAELLKAAGAK